MFVDTNVLVRAHMDGAPYHDMWRNRRTGTLELKIGEEVLASAARLCVSILAVVTRPQSWSPPLSMTDALDNMRWMMNTFQILEVMDPHVTNMLMVLCRQIPIGGRQIHDANIVATMLAHGERRLLTFNPSQTSAGTVTASSWWTSSPLISQACAGTTVESLSALSAPHG